MKRIILAAFALGLGPIQASAYDPAWIGETFCEIDKVMGRIAAGYYGVDFEGGALCG